MDLFEEFGVTGEKIEFTEDFHLEEELVGERKAGDIDSSDKQISSSTYPSVERRRRRRKFLIDLKKPDLTHALKYMKGWPRPLFDNITGLQSLDLSGTTIKTIPSSISKLTGLQKFNIRDCAMLMELPPEIGNLKNLKVFDTEGSLLVCLPWEFCGLISLEYMTCSFYIYADEERPNEQVVPVTDLKKLVKLKGINILVDSYCKWWEDEVKQVMNIFPALCNLESVRLYLPTIELLRVFLEIHNWKGVSIYKHLSDFGFIIGRVEQGLISNVPLDLDKTFVKLPKCLKYTNGEKSDTKVILMLLKCVGALSLNRHWTLPSLSVFGAANMENLKYCLLSECNEMTDVVNDIYLKGSSTRNVLGSLEYLSIYSMKSLSCIWKGPIHSASLSNLKTLAIHKCPELRTIFTEGMLDSLICLENLTLQDCTRISSFVSLGTSVHHLPNLKKISIVYLPGLVSLFHGLIRAPKLATLVVYKCTKLTKLFYSEVPVHIREIKGEREWWERLHWSEPSGRLDYLTGSFIPVDYVSEIFDDVNTLPKR